MQIIKPGTMQFSFLKHISFFLILFSVLSLTAYSQSTIQDQFDEFYEKQTSSWQEYKLVKVPRLKNFWTIVSDTLRAKENKIKSVQAEIQSLNKQLETVHTKLENTQVALTASETLNDSITFIGIPMTKSFYNILVWLIILGLTIGMVSLYLLYLRNNKVTRQARKNLAKIEQEYTAHQERAREKQTKLKRELQTALNTLQEHRIKI